MTDVGPKTAAQEQRATDERGANARAATTGEPLPFPNVWDRWDPTKVPATATAEEIQASYVRFRRLCQPRARIRHRL